MVQDDFGKVDNADNVLYQLQKKETLREKKLRVFGKCFVIAWLDSKSVYQSSFPYFELNRSKEEKPLEYDRANRGEVYPKIAFYKVAF